MAQMSDESNSGWVSLFPPPPFYTFTATHTHTQTNAPLLFSFVYSHTRFWAKTLLLVPTRKRKERSVGTVLSLVTERRGGDTLVLSVLNCSVHCSLTDEQSSNSNSHLHCNPFTTSLYVHRPVFWCRCLYFVLEQCSKKRHKKKGIF